MIGVCIKYFHENYGGMLQAFATVKMLESRGIDYELIRYKKKLTIGIYFIFVFSNKERKYIINMIKRKANIKQ